jgi:hypothetical protein
MQESYEKGLATRSANVYVHYVFDLWVEAWRKKCAQGDLIVARYADDSVAGFQHRVEAGNLDSLGVFRERVTRLWRRTLRERGQMHRIPWTRMRRLAVRWLPQPSVLHLYPEDRSAVRYLRQEPYALMSARTDLCGGY